MTDDKLYHVNDKELDKPHVPEKGSYIIRTEPRHSAPDLEAIRARYPVDSPGMMWKDIRALLSLVESQQQRIEELEAERTKLARILFNVEGVTHENSGSQNVTAFREARRGRRLLKTVDEDWKD